MSTFYKRLVRPLLFLLPADIAHKFVVAVLAVASWFSWVLRLIGGLFVVNDIRLVQKVAGLTFPNPIGIAAGFDKDGRVTKALEALGFGSIEVGSVSLLPWIGNPRPNSFRLIPDSAIINRMGLGNIGIKQLVNNLDHQLNVPIGISVAKTPDPRITGDEGIKDFALAIISADALAPPNSYLVLNVSCPNTEEGRTFESGQALVSLFRKIAEMTETSFDRPVFVKLSPETARSEVDRIMEVCAEYGVAGFVLGNTVSGRPSGLQTSPVQIARIGQGGLSGKPLFLIALELVQYVYQFTKDKNMAIIACGGISNGSEAVQMLMAGANLVQIYTSLVYEGPSLIREMNEYIAEIMSTLNVPSVSKMVGSKIV